LRHRFVVGGYVRKRVTLRISKGLRAVALAAGISRRVYSDTRVIFITIIALYPALPEKIGTPLIKEDAKHERTKAFFASRNALASTMMVPKDLIRHLPRPSPNHRK
jgi:hypothetical protein